MPITAVYSTYHTTSLLHTTHHAVCAVVMWQEDMEWYMWCDVEWYVECVTMLLNHALPHHTTTWFCDMEWCMMWCGMRYGMCYNVTAPCFATSQHHSSIIPHLTAQHSTLHHLSSCNTVHTMLCHITPPHTAHHARCGVLHHVFCDGEWTYEMWCGVMWNVLQCYQTMLWHITPPHIAHHSCTFQHHTTAA